MPSATVDEPIVDPETRRPLADFILQVIDSGDLPVLIHEPATGQYTLAQIPTGQPGDQP